MSKAKIIITVVILYLVSTAASYGAFSYFSTSSSSSLTSPLPVTTGGGLAIDPSLPKTEACPLNGVKYTVMEREIWEKRRPLAVMIENSPDARPQSGLVRSDIVYEAVAEGGVTRFMPVFLCDAARADVLIAPVRSVRTYFIDWASEYGETPLFGHVLGANCSNEPNGPCLSDPRTQALEQLSKYGWRHSKGNDLDQAAIGAPTYRRNEARIFSVVGREVATEHSMEGRTELLWKIGAERGWTNVDPEGEEWTKNFKSWKFKEEAKMEERGQTVAVSHDFWEGYKQFDVRWEYDKQNNVYKRLTGGEPHKDLETGEQITAKNVIVQLTKETGPVDSLKHMLYQTIGAGEAYIFQDGNVINGTWKKDVRTGRTIFATKKGAEITFNPGRIWISVVSNDTTVAY